MSALASIGHAAESVARIARAFQPPLGFAFMQLAFLMSASAAAPATPTRSSHGRPERIGTLKSRTARSAVAIRNRTSPISTSLMPISATTEIGSIMILEFKGQIRFFAAER